MSPLHSSPLFFRAPKRGRKCYVALAHSGVLKPKGTNLELVTSPLPSRVRKRGRKCYVTPAFSGVPKPKETR